MSNRAERAFLSDIREAVHRIEAYVEGVTYADFLQDTKLQDAVIRNLEIVGEATKKLSDELRTAYPDIPWKNMAALRDRLIHHYFGVNLDIVWQIATNDLPKVGEQIGRILENQDDENPVNL